MNFASLFSNETREATLRHATKIGELKSASENFIPDVGEPVTFLCSGIQSYESARAIRSWGIVFLGEELLLNAPYQIALTVAIHELFHLRLAREYRAAIAGRHADIVSLFHGRLIDDWLSARIELWSDQQYITDKGWRDLYDAWRGPTEAEASKAAETMGRYFEILKRGFVYLRAMKIMTIPFRALEDLSTTLIPLAEMYEESPQETAAKIVTGFELAEYLYECVESTIQSRSNLDLGTLEEGLANYASTALTGTPLHSLQAWAPQDSIKIQIAERIKNRCVGALQALHSVQRYEDLISFRRTLL